MNINKILYINARDHTNIILDFPETKEFVFTDTLPRSEIDKKQFKSIFYKKNFLNELIKKYQIINFILMEIIDIDYLYHKKIFNIIQKLYYTINKLPQYINPTLCIFFNVDTNQIIRYYISTNIMYNINELLKYDIKTCDALIINNNIANNHIKYDYFFNNINKPIIFIGYSNLYYNKKQYSNLIISKYFNKFYYINYITSEKIECNTFNNFLRYYNLYQLIN